MAAQPASYFDDRAAEWDKRPLIQQLTEAAERALRGAGVLQPGAHVLDVGCGSGTLAARLADHGAALVVGIDPSTGMVEQFNKKAAERGDGKLLGLQCELADEGSLARAATAAAAAEGKRPGQPGTDSSAEVVPQQYDLAVSCMTFHHIQDVARTVRLMRYHLRPGGQVAVIDLQQGPTSHRFHKPGAAHSVFHEGGFSPERFTQLLKDAGLEDIHCRDIHTFKKEAGDSQELLDFQLLMATGRAP